MLRQLDLGFRWEGFQKDGPNDFSVQVELSVSFEPRKYRFRCELAKLDKLLIYQDWLTEDQQTQVISAIAKGIYGQIQQRRSKNRQG